MDADIAAAAAEERDRIRLQEYRNQVRAGKAGVDGAIGVSVLTLEQDTRLEIVKAIAANYMKPTTGTLAETVAADTANDAARLKAAVDAVVAIVIGA